MVAAKLKTYPSRLNASIVLGFVDRYAHLNSHFSDDSRQRFLDSAFVDAMNRCVVVEAALAAGDDIAFHDQIHTPYSDPAHPLYDLALWPDRNACIGKDFAF